MDVDGPSQHLMTAGFEEVQVRFSGNREEGQVFQERGGLHIVDVICQVPDVDAHVPERQTQHSRERNFSRL